MRLKIFLAIFFHTVCLLTLPQIAAAASLEAWPTKVNMVRQNNMWVGKITVKNPSAEEQKFVVNTRGENGQLILAPREFTLTPNQTQDISVTAFTSPGENEIALAAAPVRQGGFSAAAGIIVPVVLDQSAKTNSIDWVSWLIYGFVVVSSLFLVSLMPKEKMS